MFSTILKILAIFATVLGLVKKDFPEIDKEN